MALEGRLRNEELYDVYSSPSFIRLIKSRRMSWVGHVACMGRGEMHARFLWGELKEEDLLRRTRHRWKDLIKLDL